VCKVNKKTIFTLLFELSRVFSANLHVSYNLVLKKDQLNYITHGSD